MRTPAATTTASALSPAARTRPSARPRARPRAESVRRWQDPVAVIVPGERLHVMSEQAGGRDGVLGGRRGGRYGHLGARRGAAVDLGHAPTVARAARACAGSHVTYKYTTKLVTKRRTAGVSCAAPASFALIPRAPCAAPRRGPGAGTGSPGPARARAAPAARGR